MAGIYFTASGASRDMATWVSSEANILLAKIKRGVVLATPVDTGTARRSWIDRGGFRPGQSRVVLENRLPYINRLEHGWSTIKAPKGMVRVTIAKHLDGSRAVKA